jgi:hypothetical protein
LLIASNQRYRRTPTSGSALRQLIAALEAVEWFHGWAVIGSSKGADTHDGIQIPNSTACASRRISFDHARRGGRCAIYRDDLASPEPASPTNGGLTALFIAG